MIEHSLHERLRLAAGHRTFRELAALTGLNHETIRRYMQGQSPSSEFLTRLCGALGINGGWLLTGRGPMLAEDVAPAVLHEARPDELLTGLSGSVATLVRRLERLEVQLQTVETRLRASTDPVFRANGQAHEHREPADGRAGDAPEHRTAAGALEAKPVASARHGQTQSPDVSRSPPQQPPTDADARAAAIARAERIAAAARRPSADPD